MYAFSDKNASRSNPNSLYNIPTHISASYLLCLLGLAALGVGKDGFLLLAITLLIQESLMVVLGLGRHW
jgi:hypothetical protein